MSDLLSVRVTPRSAKSGLGEWKRDPGGRPLLEIRVAAAPTDGEANAEVLKLLARALGIPKSALSIASGETARLKRVSLPVTVDEALARLGAPPAKEN